MHPCAFCKYDLSNQPTTYIADYHLLAVRCPECGRDQPADPALAPVRKRKQALMLVALLRVPSAFMVSIGLAAALFAVAQSAAYIGTQTAANSIWGASRSRISSSPGTAHRWWWGGVPADWWADERARFAIARRPSQLSILKDGAPEWGWLALAVPVAASIIIILARPATLKVRRRVNALPVALAALALAIYFLVQPIAYRGPTYHSGELALDTFGKPMAWLTLTIGAVLYALCLCLADSFRSPPPSQDTPEEDPRPMSTLDEP